MKYLLEQKEIKLPRIVWLGNAFLIICGVLYTLN
ncbi:olfactomedin domain-containing protein [Lysinibacillus piscis]|uniref:EamA family transporter n=1 Tax=Lysinibacillus piscis TaxID=2518931 RepID=A0ABQ5NKY3_9BACI|nr:olfactomedin domain-containing protein [Lysinibacillus sp. KH24]GLC88684.1 hypothetical protein LYSBPC_18110 [Lysinibacillus sp. KH24]